MLMTREQRQALYDFLERPEGCDFQDPYPDDPYSATWRCDRSLEKTIGWLQRQGFDVLDIQEIIAWLMLSGAYCDCEVLFNVASKEEE